MLLLPLFNFGDTRCRHRKVEWQYASAFKHFPLFFEIACVDDVDLEVIGNVRKALCSNLRRLRARMSYGLYTVMLWRDKYPALDFRRTE